MNPYSIPPFIVGMTCLLVGVLVGFKGRPRPSNFIYSTLTFSIATWFIGYAMAYSRRDPSQALVWVKMSYIGIIFIPITFYHFVVSFLGLERERRWAMWSYAAGMAFVFLDLMTDTFVSGLYHYPWGYHTKVGFLHNFYLPLFFGLNLRGFWLLHVASTDRSRELSPEQRNRLRYLFWACVIAFFGAVDFLPHYGIPIYPFGYVFLAMAAIMTTFAIVRYRLMDVNVAVTRAGLFLSSYAPLLVLPFVAGKLLEARLLMWVGANWWMIPAAFEALFAVGGLFVYRYVQQKAEARLLREQRRYQTTLMDAAKGMVQVRDLRRLLDLIIHLLTRAMKLTHAGVFLFDEKTEGYMLQASRDPDVLKIGLTLHGSDALIAWLKEHKEPLVYEEVKRWSTSQSNGTISSVDLGVSLNRLEASVVVPSFAGNALLGFLVLGDKRTGQMYSQDDLNVLQTLANQAALALQNAQFYEELQTTTAQLIHNSKLTAMGKMASGMSHQIHNRLYVLAVEAGAMREDVLPLLRIATLPESERQALLDKLDASLQSIEEESVKGSTIVKTLLQFSKPTTDMKPASLQEVVQGGLTMVSLKRDLKQLTLRLEIPEDLPRVKVNVPQLQDVFFNLVDNAYDAIDIKATRIRLGLLHVPTSAPTYQGEIVIRAEPSPDRHNLLITMSDNGIGISPEEQEQLFLPFYTKKGAEKGSGLGLFVIREILKSHGGTIRLQDSEYGKGTTFLIELLLPETGRA